MPKDVVGRALRLPVAWQQRLAPQFNETGTEGEYDKAGNIPDMEFRHEMAPVSIDRRYADPQLGRDLFARGALGNMGEDFLLTTAKAHCACGRESLSKTRSRLNQCLTGVGAEVVLAIDHPVDCLDEVAPRVCLLRKSISTAAERIQDAVIGHVGCAQENTRVRRHFLDLRNQVDAAHVGQIDIEKD